MSRSTPTFIQTTNQPLAPKIDKTVVYQTEVTKPLIVTGINKISSFVRGHQQAIGFSKMINENLEIF